VAIDDARPPAITDETAAAAASDPQHNGDILGAFGTLKREARNRGSWRRKIRFLLVIVGPGLIVMGGGNDAGGVQVYAQLGQDYGMRLLWALILLFLILYFCQEMVVRLGAVSGVGHGRLIYARFGKFWGTFSIADLFIINAVTVVAEFIGVQQALSFFGLPAGAAVAVSAVLLFAVMAGGTYRYWERFLVVLVIVNFATFPPVIRSSWTYDTFGTLPPFRIRAATFTARAASTCGACVPVPYSVPPLIALMPTARQLLPETIRPFFATPIFTPACFAPWMIPTAMLSAMP